VTLGLLPVTAFAGNLGIAILLQWSAFRPGHPSFILNVVTIVKTARLENCPRQHGRHGPAPGLRRRWAPRQL